MEDYQPEEGLESDLDSALETVFSNLETDKNSHVLACCFAGIFRSRILTDILLESFKNQTIKNKFYRDYIPNDNFGHRIMDAVEILRMFFDSNPNATKVFLVVTLDLNLWEEYAAYRDFIAAIKLEKFRDKVVVLNAPISETEFKEKFCGRKYN